MRKLLDRVDKMKPEKEPNDSKYNMIVVAKALVCLANKCET
jgi:hypothetical protein